jgi:hypothetical protein
MHGDPRRIADEFGPHERPKENTACSHFLHVIKTRSFLDATVSRGGRGNCAGSRHDEKAFDFDRDRGPILPAFRRECTGAAW